MRDHAPGRSGALVTVCLGAGIATLGSTIVNIALPRMGQSLHTGLAGLQWVVNAYLVIYAALLLLLLLLLLPVGALTDRIGRRGLFLGGVAALAAGGAWCAAAPDLPVLLAGRVVQAVGVAALVPATLAAGPLAGGVILGAAGWRAVFGCVTLAGTAVLAMGWRLIDPVRHGRGEPAGSLDVAGSAAITVFLAALSFALIEGQPDGWASPAVLVSFTIAALTLAWFTVVERRRAARGGRPLMPPGVWRIPRFAAANAGAIVYGIALFGVLFYLSLFLQDVQGRSALGSGLMFLPLSATGAVAGPFAGRLTGRYGQRTVAVAGTALAAAGVLSLALISPGSGVASLAWRFAIAGAGMGLMSTPLSSATIGALPAGSAGFAAAMYNSSRQIGGVLGVTLLGVIVASGHGFTSGLRLAMLAAGLALIASAAASAILMPGRTAIAPAAAGHALEPRGTAEHQDIDGPRRVAGRRRVPPAPAAGAGPRRSPQRGRPTQ